MSKARVSATEVKEIVSTDIDDSVLVANFIDTANLFVDTHLTTCTTNTEPTLAKIEMYLAAHLVSLSGAEGGGAIKYKKIGDASEAYNVNGLGEGLGATRYGQIAILLDTCGVLADIATPNKKAQFRVV